MSFGPGEEFFTKKEWRLIQSLRKPAQVQRYFTSMPYNWERDGGTLRSFRALVKRGEAHCLEAAVGAAVILEQHGYPPLLLDIESQDLLEYARLLRKHDGGVSSCSNYAHARVPDQWKKRQAPAIDVVLG